MEWLANAPAPPFVVTATCEGDQRCVSPYGGAPSLSASTDAVVEELASEGRIPSATAQSDATRATWRLRNLMGPTSRVVASANRTRRAPQPARTPTCGDPSRLCE